MFVHNVRFLLDVVKRRGLLNWRGKAVQLGQFPETVMPDYNARYLVLLCDAASKIGGIDQMRLTRDILLVGGGDTGFNISHPLDCHMYVIDGGDEFALVDVGIGGPHGQTDQILSNIEEDGIDPTQIGRLLLTHYHADHAGAAADMHEKVGCIVHGSPLCADVVSRGDENAISLPFAKKSGSYPADYLFRNCPAEPSLIEGSTFNVGRLKVTVYDTPGHQPGMSRCSSKVEIVPI